MVTSSRTVQPARKDADATAAARYRAEISALRRWSRAVLVAGTVLSLACAFGPLWVARIGLIPALGSALVCCLLAWREIELERRAHSAAMLAASRRHGEQLTEERRHNAVVVDTVKRRLQAADTVAASRAATISRLQADIRRLRGDVNGLRGANSRLTRDLNFRDLTIRELRETLARREAELAEAETALAVQLADAKAGRGTAYLDAEAGATGELHVLPRRPLRDAVEVDTVAVRDLAYLEAQSVITLPNYEDDRRFA
ncbi:MAG TPA: hypothetical protein VFP34_12850 [Microlunatus sp.]|nr:hypothetical protein [Microlunatus sp.]